MRTLLQLLVGAVVGILSGAVLGAALLAIPTYLDTSSGWLGTARSWTPFAAYAGAICGAVPGALIGLAVSAFKCRKRTGAAIGTVVGLCIALPLFGMTTYLDQEVRAVALFSVPLATIVGVLCATVTGAAGLRNSSRASLSIQVASNAEQQEQK